MARKKISSETRSKMRAGLERYLRFIYKEQVSNGKTREQAIKLWKAKSKTVKKVAKKAVRKARKTRKAKMPAVAKRSFASFVASLRKALTAMAVREGASKAQARFFVASAIKHIEEDLLVLREMLAYNKKQRAERLKAALKRRADAKMIEQLKKIGEGAKGEYRGGGFISA